MPLIGSRINARMALTLARTSDDYDATRQPGWKYLGMGSLRSAWLHKESGVVYKVEHDDLDHDDECWKGYFNRDEVRNARALRKMEWQHVVIPKVSGFTINNECVVAMEYVPGTLGMNSRPTYGKAGREELLSKGRFEDMHGENFKVYKGKVYPIDLASPRYRAWWACDDRILRAGDGDVGW